MNVHHTWAYTAILALVGGCSHQPTNNVVVTNESFGTRQFEQMLDDRPDMRGVVPATHPVVQWLVDGFDGKRHGRRVYWNANTPQSGRPAESAHQYGHYPPYISISGGAETTPTDKWSAAVFELNNLENSSEFVLIQTQAMEGKLDADTYASKCVELEFVAIQKTRTFFRDHPLPTNPHGGDEFYTWVSTGNDTFEEYKAAFNVPGVDAVSSNFEYFKQYYESTISPYVEAMRQAKPGIQ